MRDENKNDENLAQHFPKVDLNRQTHRGKRQKIEMAKFKRHTNR